VHGETTKHVLIGELRPGGTAPPREPTFEALSGAERVAPAHTPTCLTDELAELIGVEHTGFQR